jgi:transcriptional regulator with XRE-family HTH domain
VRSNPLTAERYGLGQRLRALRSHHKQTLADVAEVVGCTLNAVCRWELGKDEPSLHHLCLLADHFETTLDWLVRGKSVKPRKRRLTNR